jgi:hypothetical protein
MTSSLTLMHYKTQQLSKLTDSQILESFTLKFDEFLTDWDGGSHPEVLYNDGLYCELIAEKLTDEEKAEWFKHFCEEDENPNEWEDFDSLLENEDYLGEDIADDWAAKPENKNEFIIFTFKWLTGSQRFNQEEIDKRLIPFLV